METLIEAIQIAQVVNVFVAPISGILLGIAALKYLLK